MTAKTPTFLAYQTGPYSYTYRPRNEAAYRVCRLAKRGELGDEEWKLLQLLNLKSEVIKSDELSI